MLVDTDQLPEQKHWLLFAVYHLVFLFTFFLLLALFLFGLFLLALFLTLLLLLLLSLLLLVLITTSRRGIPRAEACPTIRGAALRGEVKSAGRLYDRTFRKRRMDNVG